MATTAFHPGGYPGRPYGSFAGRAPVAEPTPATTSQRRGFAGFPRSHLWIAHINGKRYVGTYDELEEILGDVVEKTAKKPRVVIKPGTPVIREGAVSVMPEKATMAEAKVVQHDLMIDIAPLLARVIRQREDDEDEDLMLLM